MTRLERLRADLGRLGTDAALVVSAEANRRYLSGFRGDAGILWVTSQDAALITDARFWDQAEQECPDWRLVRLEGQTYGQALAQLTAERGIRVLGFEAAAVTYQTYLGWRRELRGVRLRPLGGVVERLRLVKEPEEVAAIRGAAQAVDQAFRRWLPLVRPGAVERELAAELEHQLRLAGAEGTSFPPIVAGGAHGAQPHAVAADRALEAGELVVVDVGARLDGYCSDMTRTVAVPGAPSTDEAHRIFAVVHQALRAGLAVLRPGVRGRDVDAAARGVIEAAGYGACFGHGTGHGVGLEVHEGPGLSWRTPPGVRVPAGAVVTVEPGIYLPGRLGVRLEELVHVGAAGTEILSRAGLGL